jgi:hypothetical protein
MTDLHEALEFLSSTSPVAGDEFHLHRFPFTDCEWELVAPWFTSGSSGGDRSGYHYYQIDPVLATELVKEGFVEKRRVRGWGYTRVVEDELVITEAGRQKLEAYLKEMRAKAESLLKPGVHTDLTGEVDHAGHNRDGYHCGKLYFEFRIPNQGRCRVYPEEGRLLEPEELAALP